MTRFNYLDRAIINEFRESLNSSPIFYAEEEYKKNWNLVCAMMDRVDSSVDYINSFDISHFDTEETLINFLTYCCILKDSIIQLFDSILPLNVFYKNNVKEQTKHFNKDFERFISEYNKNSKEKTCSDDKFFEFIRSITFAHPLDTNRQKFIKNHDKFFSPFVLVNSLFNDRIDNPIGVAIYSLLDDKTIHFWFSANHLINYVRDKYNLLKQAKDWLNKEISKHCDKWQKRKVNRNLQCIDLLYDIKEILQERHADICYINDAISLLKCEETDKSNSKKVARYKKALVETCGDLSDWIDSLQDENLTPQKFFDMLDPMPKVMYPQAHYELSKIFSYLDDEIIDFNTYVKNRDIYIRTNGEIDVSNFEWGLVQAELFFKSFGNQYINFDLSNIHSATEVKLLTKTALYMEVQKQKSGHISRCITKLLNESKKKREKLKVLDTLKYKSQTGEDIIISIVDASVSNDIKKDSHE